MRPAVAKILGPYIVTPNLHIQANLHMNRACEISRDSSCENIRKSCKKVQRSNIAFTVIFRVKVTLEQIEICMFWTIWKRKQLSATSGCQYMGTLCSSLICIFKLICIWMGHVTKVWFLEFHPLIIIVHLKKKNLWYPVRKKKIIFLFLKRRPFWNSKWRP